jgi:hypothetical protein
MALSCRRFVIDGKSWPRFLGSGDGWEIVGRGGALPKALDNRADLFDFRTNYLWITAACSRLKGCLLPMSNKGHARYGKPWSINPDMN